MDAFTGLTKIILFPLYFLIHRNIFFGFIHKYLIKNFNFKGFKIKLEIDNIPLSNYSSFLFNTYEYNDRVLVEKYIDKKNKCIIIGGGIGFIAVLAYHKSLQSIMVSEINKKILKNLENSLSYNNCKFKIIKENLVIGPLKKKYSVFFLHKNFISTSKYMKTKYTEQSCKVKNINIKKIKNINSFNTLVIDGEGIEEHFIENISKLTHIKYIIFEIHHNILNKKKVKNLFNILNSNKFKKVDSCFNSYYFKKI
jgi:FkbM family methyltransferase